MTCFISPSMRDGLATDSTRGDEGELENSETLRSAPSARTVVEVGSPSHTLRRRSPRTLQAALAVQRVLLWVAESSEGRRVDHEEDLCSFSSSWGSWLRKPTRAQAGSTLNATPRSRSEGPPWHRHVRSGNTAELPFVAHRHVKPITRARVTGLVFATSSCCRVLAPRRETRGGGRSSSRPTAGRDASSKRFINTRSYGSAKLAFSYSAVAPPASDYSGSGGSLPLPSHVHLSVGRSAGNWRVRLQLLQSILPRKCDDRIRRPRGGSPDS